MIPKNKIQNIKDGVKLTSLIPNLQKAGKNFCTPCPGCGKTGKGKGLIVDPVKNFAKCFSCDFYISDAIDYLMKVENMEFIPAIERLANDFGYDIEPDEAREKRLKNEKVNVRRESFCDKQLESSGLTYEDVSVVIQEDGKEIRRPAFMKGTRDQYNRILIGSGDDMLIFYYDLQGKPVQYKQERTGRFLDLVRVRWSNPELHKDKNGKPIKYQSPAGSGSHLYIPEAIRVMYRNKRSISRLFIQEGEKKAEKCCKHGIMSVGIMGIQNLGFNNQLPEDLQILIQECEVKEVVFLLDSDWNHLSSNLKVADQVDQRPLSFFYAVKNYKEYMRTLVNVGISVEIYFGHVRENQNNDKGIDDLLANTLKGRENEFKEDVEFSLHDKQGKGNWVQMHKITQMPDNKIADYWLLNDAEEFAKFYRTKLEGLKEFKIGKLLRRFDDNGDLALAQPLADGEEFWDITETTTRDGDTKKTLSFNYYKAWQFLQHRGYYQIKMKSGVEEFALVENKIITKMRYVDIRNFVTAFVKEIKKIDVLNMLYRGGPQYLGPEKLSNLDTISPQLDKATKFSQRLYFSDKFWDISPEGIVEKPYTQLTKFVWSDKIINFSPKILPEFVDVELIREEHIKKLKLNIEPDKEFSLEFSKDAEKCDFFKFLYNASNFYWKKKPGEITNEEKIEWCRHMMNKLTAIGYLLHDYKNESELKAVIIMDGKMSEVGASNGRTGKSLMMKSLEHVIPQLYVPAKSKKLTEDQFIWGEVTEKVKNIFLDDVRANVDFEFFFPLITGKLKVNPKGGLPFTLEPEDTPKLAITTNHAINGEGSSFKARQALVAFSDYYNDRHQPIHDFGKNFFGEWDNDDWNLFYNLMANCLLLYFRSLKNGWAKKDQGIVDPPMETLEKRRLRQSMGEIFLTWADAYFTKENLNVRMPRQTLYDKFCEFDSNTKKYYNSTKFGKAIKAYCEYSGYHLNPQKNNEEGVLFPDFIREFPEQSFFGSMDKSGGVEYFTIADSNWHEII